MNTDIIWSFVLQIVLIGLNAVFACAEIAVISMNGSKLNNMAENGDKRAVRLAKLTSQPSRFLATIQVAITLAGFLGSAFAADSFSDPIVDWLINLGIGIPRATLNAAAVIFITLILSFFTLVFGELVPKRLAMKKTEELALGMSALLTFVSKLFAPIVWVLTVSTNLILKLLKIDPDAEEEEVSEEEIRMMVDIGSKKGVIDYEEKEFIDNIFKFDDLDVGEFATHRTDIEMLRMDETVEEWHKTICESNHSLYPVCGDTVDSIVGILSAKEYFRLKDKSKQNILDFAVKPAYFVPEQMHADVLFKQMKQLKQRIAVVLDEYGGVCGIVTINDLIEQLVGDFDDTVTEGAEPEIQQLDSETWRIKGIVSIEKVEKIFNVSLPSDKNDTFGGFVFAEYGRIPKDGEQFELDSCGLHIKALEIKEHRLENAVVSLRHDK